MRRLVHDEAGGSMVFGAITAFTLVLFVMLIYHTGVLSADQMAVQNAADAAAYSGALVGANSLDSIASINDGMAYVYYTLMRYSLDIITYGVLKEFSVHDQHVRQAYPLLGNLPPLTGLPIGAPTNPPAPDGIIMPGANFSELYDRALTNARDMIPHGVRWLQLLAESERLIARATPAMMEEVIFEVAKANGGELVSVFPPLDEEFFYGGSNSILADAQGRGGALPSNFYDRYQPKQGDGLNFERAIWPREPSGVAVPEWYDPSQARSRGQSGYFQVRLCWNLNDLNHGERQGVGSETPEHYGLDPYVLGPPNGHWHFMHIHLVQLDPTGTFPPIPVPHYGGHGYAEEDNFQYTFLIHELALDNGLPTFPHHARSICPTCVGRQFVGSGHTEVKATERASSPKVGNLDQGPHVIDRSYRELLLPFGNRPPVPLVLTNNLRFNGVNVGVFRSARLAASRMFPTPGWGHVATASARIGMVDLRSAGSTYVVDIKGDRGTWLKNFATANPSLAREYEDNLYPTDEVSFSARLALMTMKSYGKAGGGQTNPGNYGLKELLVGNRWRRSPNSTPDGRGIRISTELRRQLSFDGRLQQNIHH